MKETTDKTSDVARREEEILKFWNENRIFEKSQEKPAPKGEFVFYDGPPFANGLPHFGHILAGTIKDALPRYKTMRGYRVRRKWGWDCHGLPVENEIEKELGLKSKKDIEEHGVGKFNEAARNAVLRYADDWRRIIPRMGRWVDMDRDYKTMDASYTESVWWIFKTIFDKGLIYEGFKSMHLCPRCGTTLSNFEVAQGYEDIVDFAVTVKLELKDKPGTFLLVWTTTPWTLPGNMAAAVNKDAMYVLAELVEEAGVFSGEKPPKVVLENYILAKDILVRDGELIDANLKKYLWNGKVIKIHDEFKGSNLVGKSYVPPFPYYLKKDIENKENAWKIYHASYVSLEDGTGAVHLAPAFGAEDLELAQAENIPIVHHVKEDGTFGDDVTDFRGQHVKPKDTKEEKDKHQLADIEIIKHLAHKGLLFKKEKTTHSYPHCWRCDTPLLNYASSSWFLKVTQIKDKLVSENEKISWVPKEIGEKRFGNWLKNARDWAISRSRYWGAPLPVWKNEKTGDLTVMGSVEDLKRCIKKSGNSYTIIRHGEAESNLKSMLNSSADGSNHLTEKGRAQVLDATKKLKQSTFDLIIASPLTRAQETAEIISTELNCSKENILTDERLREISFGVLEGHSRDEYWSFFSSPEARFDQAPEGAETVHDVKKRVGDFIYEIERKYSNKNILIVAHEDVLWMLSAITQGANRRGCLKLKSSADDFFSNAEVRDLPFVPLPHDKEYVIDLHRPHIDEIELYDEGGAKLVRVPDVFDCWFESGSMPYGQQHYPFANTDIFEPKGGWFKSPKGYPADFIAEGLDQTRGWFYSLLVLGTALFNRAPYKHVIVNGLILGEDGTKLSKSLKNYADPMEVVSSYGADALRYYLLSSPIVRAEDFIFSEKGVGDVMRKLITRLQNVHAFYALYSKEEDQSVVGRPTSTHILDKWILARLDELINQVTEGMERYELDRATRPIGDFIDDLSTWYIRRSRDRFKGEDAEDKKQALLTTRFVLEEVAKVIAPFMPFYAESLYKEVSGGEEESVHLTSWPLSKSVDSHVLKDMQDVREVVSFALEARDVAGIKVRQPLQKLFVQAVLSSEFIPLIKDEVNVKEVVCDKNLKEKIILDTTITSELKDEGVSRDFTRYVQNLRKEQGLTPDDRIILTIDTDKKGRELLEKYLEEIKTVVLADSVVWEKAEGETCELDSHTFTASLKRHT